MDELNRKSVEECKDRIVTNLKIMRAEYPHLFKHCNTLLHEEVES